MNDPRYIDSRKDLLRRAANLSGDLQFRHHSVTLPEVLGPEGEDLITDVLVLGPEDASSALMHIAGVHGVEGHLGSLIQRRILSEFAKDSLRSTKVIFVHAFNAFGMAWNRRVNYQNIDLNRNYRSVGFHEPDVSVYRSYHSFLNPREPEELWGTYKQGLSTLLKVGYKSSIQMIAQGQYQIPRGLFYGGAQTSLEFELCRSVLQRSLQSVESLVAIDVHTGLGHWGQESLFPAQDMDEEECEELAQLCGLPHITSVVESGGYTHSGAFSDYIGELTKGQALYVLQEFGTYAPLRVLTALRAENHFHHYGADNKNMNHKVKKRLQEMFFPKSSRWRQAVVHRGTKLFWQILRSLDRP